jgi:putative DNA primase/helicase
MNLPQSKGIREPDGRESVLEFLTALFSENPKGQILIWAKDPASGGKKLSYWGPTPMEVLGRVPTKYLQDWDVYYGIGLSPSDRGPYYRCEAEEIIGIGELWSDFDVAGPGHKESPGKVYPPTFEAIDLILGQGPLPPSFVVCSGGGLQPHWLLDRVWYFKDAEERERAVALIIRWQEHLRSMMQINGWALDSTHDLARVMRLPGTFNHKIKGNPRAVELRPFNVLRRYTLQEIIEAVPASTPARADIFSLSSRAGTEEPNAVAFTIRPDAEPPGELLTTLLDLHPKFKGSWDRNRPDMIDQSPSAYDMSLAVLAASAGWSDQEIVDLLIAWRRKHGIEAKLRKDYYDTTLRKAQAAAFEKLRAIMDEDPEDFAADPDGRGVNSAEILGALERNEVGDADLFVELHRDRFTYDHAAARWYTWAGHHWQEDLTEAVLGGVRRVVGLYYGEMRRQGLTRANAASAGQPSKSADAKRLENLLSRRIRELQARRRMDNVLYLAKTGGQGLGITGDEWDRDPMALAVENGVIDLRSGKLRDGVPGEYLKTFAPIEWKGIDEPRPTWEAFLHSTFNADEALVAFMHRLLGSAICGKIIDHILPILWGSGRNGKTVLLQAVADCLGKDLTGPVDAELLLENKSHRPSGAPQSDLAHLRGRRLAWLSETNENRRINSGKVKVLTGNDFITCRPPYGARQITFVPTHTLFLLTNHRPKADPRDMALWSRVLLIPFTLAFVDKPDPEKPNERQADPDLSEKLRGERAGILAWLVAGCLEWQRTTLDPPQLVRGATKEYRDAEDTFEMFKRECCEEGAKLQVGAADAYQAYRRWCEESGEIAMSANQFGRLMAERFESQKPRAVKIYVGVGLLRSF